MNFIKKTIISILCFRNKSIVKKKCIIGKSPIISHHATIKLIYNSNPNDIIIGDNFKFTGQIISSNNGKIKIGDRCILGPNCIIGAINSVEIGNDVWISNNVVVIDNNNHPVNPLDRLIVNRHNYDHNYRSWYYSKNEPIKIQNNVWIGRNVIICKGVTIGENSIIASGSIVTKDVDKNCIVAGNPAKVVKIDIDKEERLII